MTESLIRFGTQASINELHQNPNMQTEGEEERKLANTSNHAFFQQLLRAPDSFTHVFTINACNVYDLKVTIPTRVVHPVEAVNM